MYRDLIISVIVPAYNEESLIGETLGSIPGYIDYIFVVDDGSKDSTWSVILEFVEKDRKIVPLQHEKNLGVGAAIITGYRKVLEKEVDVAVVMAGDNQMDPAYLPDLLDPIIEERADYTKGNRLFSPEYRKAMSRWRLFGNTLLTLLTKIASGYWHISDPQNGYTAISRQTLEKIDPDTIYTYYGYLNDILVKLNVYGFRVIDVPHPARYGNEKSKIKYSKYIPKVSWLLLKCFFWRLKMKYIQMDKSE